MNQGSAGKFGEHDARASELGSAVLEPTHVFAHSVNEHCIY